MQLFVRTTIERDSHCAQLLLHYISERLGDDMVRPECGVDQIDPISCKSLFRKMELERDVQLAGKIDVGRDCMSKNIRAYPKALDARSSGWERTGRESGTVQVHNQ